MDIVGEKMPSNADISASLRMKLMSNQQRNLEQYSQKLEDIQKEENSTLSWTTQLTDVPPISQVMDALSKEIKKRHPHLKGQMIGVGSHYDKTKIPPADEQDFIYLISLEHLHIKLYSPHDLLYLVRSPELRHKTEWQDIVSGGRIYGAKLSQTFSHIVHDIMKDIELPEGLTHGGIFTPHFSGVRENLPALTLLFCYRDLPVTVDVSPCLDVPAEHTEKILSHIPSAYSTHLSSVLRDHPVARLVLIPTEDQAFSLSTTLVEVTFLGGSSFPPVARDAIILCKFINSKVFNINAVDDGNTALDEHNQNIVGQVTEAINNNTVQRKFLKFWQDELGGNMDSDDESPGAQASPVKHSRHCHDPEGAVLFSKAIHDRYPDRTDDLKRCLKELLNYSWILKHGIPPQLQKDWTEKDKALLSTSSCIFKYKVLEKLLSGDIDTRTTANKICIEVLREYLQEIQNPTKSFRHPFLGHGLPIRSSSPFLFNRSIPGLNVAMARQVHTQTVETTLNIMEGNLQL